MRYVYNAPSPCKDCKGRCKKPATGKPVWSIETLARTGKDRKQPVYFFDHDCPSSLQYAPAAYLVELWQQHNAGLSLPELSAEGRAAFAYIHETITGHRRLMHGHN